MQVNSPGLSNSMPVSTTSSSGSTPSLDADNISLTLQNANYTFTKDGLLQTPNGTFRVKLGQQTITNSNDLTVEQRKAIENLAKDIFEKMKTQPGLNPKIDKVERISVQSSNAAPDKAQIQVKLKDEPDFHQIVGVDVKVRMQEIFAKTVNKPKDIKPASDAIEDQSPPDSTNPATQDDQSLGKSSLTQPDEVNEQESEVKLYRKKKKKQNSTVETPSSSPVSQSKKGPNSNQESITVPHTHTKPRGICGRAGNTCVINTTLQLMAHFKPYSFVFTLPIAKKPNEEEQVFKKREELQVLGKQMIEDILAGNNPKDTTVGNFITLLGECGVIPPEQARALARDGGDISTTLDWIFKILIGHDATHTNSISVLGFDPILFNNQRPDDQAQLKKNEQAYMTSLEQVATKKDCFMIKASELSQTPIAPEIVVNGRKFILEVVIKGGTGHTYPYIRSDNGFIKYNDLSFNNTSGYVPPKPEKFSNVTDVQKDATDGWFSLYYVLADKTENSNKASKTS